MQVQLHCRTIARYCGYAKHNLVERQTSMLTVATNARTEILGRNQFTFYYQPLFCRRARVRSFVSCHFPAVVGCLVEMTVLFQAAMMSREVERSDSVDVATYHRALIDAALDVSIRGAAVMTKFFTPCMCSFFAFFGCYAAPCCRACFARESPSPSYAVTHLCRFLYLCR